MTNKEALNIFECMQDDKGYLGDYLSSQQLAAIDHAAALMREAEAATAENLCQLCKQSNIIPWHAASPLWNAVMRNDGVDEFPFVCPNCFIRHAQAKGINGSWCLRLHDMSQFPTVFDDGRVWDAQQCKWVEAATAPDVSEAELAECEALCEKATPVDRGMSEQGVHDVLWTLFAKDGTRIASCKEHADACYIWKGRDYLLKAIAALRAARKREGALTQALADAKAERDHMTEIASQRLAHETRMRIERDALCADLASARAELASVKDERDLLLARWPTEEKFTSVTSTGRPGQGVDYSRTHVEAMQQGADESAKSSKLVGQSEPRF